MHESLPPRSIPGAGAAVQSSRRGWTGTERNNRQKTGSRHQFSCYCIMTSSCHLHEVHALYVTAQFFTGYRFREEGRHRSPIDMALCLWNWIPELSCLWTVFQLVTATATYILQCWILCINSRTLRTQKHSYWLVYMSAKRSTQVVVETCKGLKSHTRIFGNTFSLAVKAQDRANAVRTFK
jgi:hypothetical protein